MKAEGQDINKVIKKIWRIVSRGSSGVFEHPNQPPGYHRTTRLNIKARPFRCLVS